MLKALRNWLRTDEEPSQVAPEPTNVPDPVGDDLRFQVDRLRAEWAELQLHWAEVLDKITAWSNRQAARDRKLLGKSMKHLEEQELERESIPAQLTDVPPADVKAELRRRVAMMRGRAG